MQKGSDSTSLPLLFAEKNKFCDIKKGIRSLIKRKQNQRGSI